MATNVVIHKMMCWPLTTVYLQEAFDGGDTITMDLDLLETQGDRKAVLDLGVRYGNVNLNHPWDKNTLRYLAEAAYVLD